MGLLPMVLRYWHTLRYLRPVQFYGRLWFRLYRPRLDLTSAPKLRLSQGLLRTEPLGKRASLVFPLPRPVSMLGPARFRFLNDTHDALGPDAWNDAARDKLWLYNLHYFDDLNAVDAAGRANWHRALVQRWIAENPPGHGNGWEPYPTSLRIVNWVKWLQRASIIRASARSSAEALNTTVSNSTDFPTGKPESSAMEGNPALSEAQSDAAIIESLAVQARWLCRRLEHHLLGNHLFANAKALVFAGVFFVGLEAERWLQLGQRLLRRELNEQVLSDGGHFERSPMYHAILLEDVLDLMQLAQVYPGVLDASLLNLCEEKAGAMLHWLAAMTHPDGQISFFNDTAFGIAATLSDLARYAESLRRHRSAPSPISEPPNAVIPTEEPESSDMDVTGDAGAEAHEPPASSPSLAMGSGFPVGTTGHRDNSTQHPHIWLRDSGYVRFEAGPAVALLDVAPIGPDYLPGHAHADTLSFELSLFGERVIVNGGTSRYGSGPERLAERGTAAHSTVQIDGADSSEVWGGFRVARRARPFDVRVRFPPDQLQIIPYVEVGSRRDRATVATANDFDRFAEDAIAQASAAHDGYCRLPGGPVHRRYWQLAEDHLRVSDRIECRDPSAIQLAVARFHLHPDVQASITGQSGELRLQAGQTLRWRVSGGEPRIVPDLWHPAFGQSVPSTCLEVKILAGKSVLALRWN